MLYLGEESDIEIINNDSNGNITNDATHTYQFSQRNRLGTVDNGTTANYNYDGDGRRVKKVVGSTTTLYFYDTEGKLLEEFNPQTGEGKDYLWIPKSYEPIARFDFAMSETDTGDCLRVSKSSPNVHLDWSLFSGSGNFPIRRGVFSDFTNFTTLTEQTSKTYNDPVLDNTTSYWYDIRNRSLTDTLYFYHSDHLGTPIAMTDTSAMLVWRAEHSPFGGIYALTVSTISNNLRFPGQYYDSETGLAQNWFRDYDGKIGRYREVDPVKVKIFTNPYSYANLNPSQEIDFKGLQGSVSSGAKQTVFVCCASANIGSGAHYGKHCYVQVGKFKYELQPKSQWLESTGYTQKVPAPIDPNADCAGTTRCNLKDCVDKAFSSYPSESHYLAVNGPNSNTFAAYIAEKCKLNIPKSANSKESPGWGCAAPR